MSDTDDYWPAHYLPNDTTQNPPQVPPSHPRRVHRRATARQPRSEPAVFPKWYASERSQRIAEWLAFNAALDRLLGLPPSLDREPYSLFKPQTVEVFLARLAAENDSTTTTQPNTGRLQ